MAITTTINLSDLLVPPTRSQIEASLLAILQAADPPFPISDWQPGGVEKTIIQALATGLLDLSAASIPTVTRGGFVDLAAGAWLTLIAEQLYQLNRLEATRTIGNEQLDCAAGSGPYTINPGTLFFQGTSGNIYTNKTGGTLQAPGFSSVTHVGVGTGTVTPATGIVVTITTGGVLNAGQFTYQIGTGPVSAPVTLPLSGVFPIPNTNTTITFSAGTYVLGTTYTISLTLNTISQAGPGPSATQVSLLNHAGKSLQVKIIGAGGLGVGTFQFSTDGGVTFGTTTTIPAGGVFTDTDTGATIVFSGTFNANDTYSYSSLGRITISIESEFPNDSTATPPRNYVDPSGSITRMITSLVGVTASNPAPDFSGAELIGTSVGIVRMKRTSLAIVPTPSTIVVRIDTTGQAGVMTWSYSINGGAFISGGAAVSLAIAGNTTIQIFNGVTSPSFIAGDTFTVVSPGTWITTQGVDEESDVSLQTRCKARWPDLADIPTQDVYEFWARSASSQVTKVTIITDPIINNKVLIYVAGAAGPLSAGVINIVQQYIDPRAPLTDFPQVLSPVVRSVALSAASVYVTSTKLAAAQQLAQAAVATYMGAAAINGKIILAQIIENVMAIDGVSNLTGLSIVGANSGPDLQLPVTAGAVEVAQWTQNLLSLWTWIPT